MKNVKVLDCTLRDGGRIIDCAFSDKEISDIVDKLSEAKIDIIEIGFLRDWRDVTYDGNSTFFTDVEQIRPFIKNQNSRYVAFVDYGMFDFETLKPYDGTSIDGIRVGFTKKDFNNSLDDIIKCLKVVKEKGYRLFIQGVNSLNYSDREMLDLVEMVNEIHPYGFGIVDTYGAMYMDDIQRIFRLVDNNILPDICIDFHSHNNYQMSFALAQEVIRLSRGVRNVIIDATLNGMGKTAGNLNTELIVDYLARKKHMGYEFDVILDLIDDYIYSYKENEEWGYSIPGLMAGVYQSHPNNICYLTEKFRLQTKDIKNLVSMIEPAKRQRYDYDNIERLYLEYNGQKINDESTIYELREIIANQNVLVIAPGISILENREQIEKYIEEKRPFVISVNFVHEMADCSFFGNKKRYANSKDVISGKKCIVTSNISRYDEGHFVVNYYSLINMEYEYFENSLMMLLALLRRLDVKSIQIAGFDGFNKDKQNYIDKSFQNSRHRNEFDKLNRELEKMFTDFVYSVSGKIEIKFLTPSIFEKC